MGEGDCWVPQRQFWQNVPDVLGGGEQSPWDVEAAFGASWALGWGGGGDAPWRSGVRACACARACVFTNLVAGDWHRPSPYPCELFSCHQFGTLLSAYCMPEPEGVLSILHLHGSSTSFHLLHPLWSKWWAHPDMAGKLRLREVKPPVKITPQVTRSQAGMLTWVIGFKGSSREPTSGAPGEEPPSCP